MITNHHIFVKWLALLTLCAILSGLVGCNSGSNSTNNATKNKDYAKDTFNSYYSVKDSDLVINKDTEKWGELKCGECTYYEFDSYSANSSEKNLFHNVIIIRTSDKAMSWFLYDDNFSTYILKNNLEIGDHGREHKTLHDETIGEKETSMSHLDYKWWEEYGTEYICNDDKDQRRIIITTYDNRDGSTHLEFSCSERTSWTILNTESFSVTYTKENGNEFYSYTGYIYDTYKDGEIWASGVEPNDTICVIFSTADKSLTVTSLFELMNGESPYPVMCSGTYSPS